MKTTTIQEIVDYLYRCDEDFNYVAFMYLLENANNLSLETKAEIRVSIDGKAYPEKVSLREAIEINRKADFFYGYINGKNPDPAQYQLQLNLKVAIKQDDIIKQNELIEKGADPTITFEGHNYWRYALALSRTKTLKFFKHRGLCQEAIFASIREQKEKELMGEI